MNFSFFSLLFSIKFSAMNRYCFYNEKKIKYSLKLTYDWKTSSGRKEFRLTGTKYTVEERDCDTVKFYAYSFLKDHQGSQMQNSGKALASNNFPTGTWS